MIEKPIKYRKIAALAIFLLLFFFAGYFRDFLFVNTNLQLYKLSSNKAEGEGEVDAALHIITSVSYNQLYIAKWIMTIIFCLIYLGISYLIVQLLFKEKKYRNITITTYGILLFISFLVTVIGYFINDNTWTYKLSRYLMGIAKSPIVIMILIPAFKLKSIEKLSD